MEPVRLFDNLYAVGNSEATVHALVTSQGIILIGVLGILLDDELQRLNACKNVLALTVNSAASIVFIATAEVNWAVVGTIALGSVVGVLVTAFAMIPHLANFDALLIVAALLAGLSALYAVLKPHADGPRVD